MDLLHSVGLAVNIAIFFFLATYRQRDPERFKSAYKAALTIALLFVLWIMIPHVRAYGDMVMHQARESRRITAQLHKLSVADLQAEYVRARIVSPNAGLRCMQAERDWDYVCSYMPTPSQSRVRLEFGVIVDETRVLQTSRRVPEGTVLPSPQ